MTGRQGWNLRRGGPTPRPKLEEHSRWKGDAACDESKRARAQRMYELAECERCGVPATDRHHKDGNTGNNVPENIARLCRRCHMAVDGRAARLAEAARARSHANIKPPEPCVICGVPYKPRRKGRCAACAVYFGRTGRERGPKCWKWPGDAA